MLVCFTGTAVCATSCILRRVINLDTDGFLWFLRCALPSASCAPKIDAEYLGVFTIFEKSEEQSLSVVMSSSSFPEPHAWPAVVYHLPHVSSASERPSRFSTPHTSTSCLASKTKADHPRCVSGCCVAREGKAHPLNRKDGRGFYSFFGVERLCIRRVLNAQIRPAPPPAPQFYSRVPTPPSRPLLYSRRRRQSTLLGTTSHGPAKSCS